MAPTLPVTPGHQRDEPHEIDSIRKLDTLDSGQAPHCRPRQASQIASLGETTGNFAVAIDNNTGSRLLAPAHLFATTPASVVRAQIEPHIWSKREIGSNFGLTINAPRNHENSELNRSLQ